MASNVRDKELLLRFGKHLRELRESKGLTQEQLANLCDIEYSQISRIELGKINTTISTLFLLAQHLKVTVKQLVDLPAVGY
ncbi:MAG: helix-turn-helix transcriptional regulator [Bacteroidetes bacterium]|nr:helix-turn-helix transcriptional regulator [Bacteroidota bacterium]